MTTNILNLSIIIPFKDKSELTIACVTSLQKYSPNIKEIILISNNSSEKELSIIREFINQYDNVRLRVEDIPFNFQVLNNIGIRAASGKVVMMLNNDTEFTKNSVGLLDAMYNKAIQEDSGAIGAVLLFEDQKTIQHAGVYLVPGGTADHLYLGQSLNKVTQAKKPRFDITEDLRVSAVTAAALMVRKDHFTAVKGMDERFIVCGGDVDFCLRLEEKGLKNYVVGSKYGTIIHKESKTRSVANVPYVDFCESYRSYLRHFDMKKGDVYIPWKEVPRA